MLQDIDGAEGIWAVIVQVCPRPELLEIRTVLGSKLIDSNQKLWEELKVLRTILTQLHTFDLEPVKTPTNTMSNTNRNNDVVFSNNSLRLDLNRLNDSPPKSTLSSARSSDAVEYVRSIRSFICVDKIHLVENEIRNLLKEEKEDLEQEIKSLTEIVDGEADIICSTPRNTVNTNNKSPVLDKTTNRFTRSCTRCGRQDQLVGMVRQLTSKEFVCNGCKETQSKSNNNNISPNHNGFFANPSTRDFNSNNTNNRDDIENNTVGVVSKRRFRDRIQAATDERFFLDD